MEFLNVKKTHRVPNRKFAGNPVNVGVDYAFWSALLREEDVVVRFEEIFARKTGQKEGHKVFIPANELAKREWGVIEELLDLRDLGIFEIFSILRTVRIGNLPKHTLQDISVFLEVFLMKFQK